MALVVLSLTGTALLHLRVESRDGRWLLLVDGVPRDPLGRLSERWLALTRDCSAVRTLQPADRDWPAAQQALAAYSPPDSRSARVVGLVALGPWRLAEARFDALEPAVVLLHEVSGRLQVREGAIWSGSTHPWNRAAFIRRYLAGRAPEAPAALLACYTLPSASPAPASAPARAPGAGPSSPG